MHRDEREFHWANVRWGRNAASLPMIDAELMSVVLEHIATRVAIVAPDMRYLYANREALRFMGLPAQRVIGQHMADVLDERVYRNFVPIFERLFAGESLHLQGWVEYERQGRRYREQILVPYARGDGPVAYVIVCGLDHTAQRRNEEELAAQREQLRASEALKAAIFDHALAALISTDVDGRIVEFNPSAEVMFGHARAQVLGRPVGEIIVPERFREAHAAGLERMRQGGGPRVLGRRIEMHALRADGREFPMELVLWQSEAEGKVVYTASIADLSERQEAARQIERQREALRQSEKLTAMGSLLAGVAHELNNPLAVVMGRANLLQEKCEGNPELQLDAARIHEAAERCGRIVRTFLNMARSRPDERRPVMLNEIVRAATDMLAYAYRSHDVDLVLELDPGLPLVEADGDQICQVVLNLLVNAQQALGATVGERRVTVRTSVEHGDGDAPAPWLRLRVTDNGPGIAAELQARVFERFFTTKPATIGTGLGLAVSREVARRHGGDLVLEHSSLGVGTAFVLSLPIVALEGQALPSRPEVASEVPALGRVLVVDDEAELADLMRDMLERAGYDVATAESGAVALELLEEARFDAVVSDLRMPDMDGAALWRQISARHPALARRVLFITGDTLSLDAAELLAVSQCIGLEKPFSKAELLAQVAALLV